MDNRIAKNYIYNTIYQLLLVILPLITTPYISRVLGVKNVGIYSYTNTVVQYFITFSQLGLNLYGKREISYIRNDKDKTSGLFWKLIIARGLLYLIAILAYCGFINITNRYKELYIIYVPMIIAGAFDISWFFQALEDFKIITIRNLIIKLISTACIFLFVKSDNSLPIYIGILSLSELISQVSLWLGIGKGVSHQKPQRFSLSDIYKGSFIMFLPQVITTIYTLADKLILGLLSDEIQVGLYSQSEKIVKLLVSIIGSMGLVMMPRVANLFHSNNDSDILNLLEKSKRWAWFISIPMMFGLIGISDGLVVWFFGPGYEDVSLLMKVICPIILFIGLSDLYGMQYLIPTGHTREYTLSALYGAIFNVVFNILLVGKFKAVGVSVASVLSELLITVSMYLYSRKYIEWRKKFYWNYVALGAVMGSVVYLLDRILPDTIIATMLEIVVGIVLYIILLIISKDSMFIEIFKRIKKKEFI